ncbi:Cytosine/adenosine deaminase [Rhizobiales bacterium GAS191]|jgi:5-methylthioadenosine/S-adenosylhomocysteine deaminase|nr:Cytosine/adenosine deaminase [Rhizobiales bacterium GAS113]SED35085.1 Cytosine/adenosine deaminase [Rhizobiales bacterium GAS191]
MKRTLIRCGWIVTMDASIGDRRDAEILIEDDRIRAIGRDLGEADEVIEAGDMIAMPGLIDAHLHTWQTGLRAIGCEWGHGGYFRHIHGGMATLYGPEDNYIGTLVGALTRLSGGVTTLLDYCHNITSSEQAERSVDGLEESGIRAVYALGAGKFQPDREAIEPFEQRLHPRERVERLRRRLSGSDRLVTMALAVGGPHWAELEPTRRNIRLARELGLRTTSHATKRPADAVAPDGYRRLIEEGLLGPDHNIVHGNFLGDEELKRIIGAGVSVTSTVQTELRGYASPPLVSRVRALGALPSLGVDVEPRVSGEMFREMHVALLYALNEAQRDNAFADGAPFSVAPIRSREALSWATIGGAEAIGLGHAVGSLTPGKKADIVLLRATDLNVFPVHDPLLTIVEMANAGNVDTVLVGGTVRKRGGKLTVGDEKLASLRAELSDSVLRVMHKAGYTQQAS